MKIPHPSNLSYTCILGLRRGGFGLGSHRHPRVQCHQEQLRPRSHGDFRLVSGLAIWAAIVFNLEIFILHIKYQFLLHFRQVRLPSDRARAVPGDRPEGEGRHDRRRREAEARLHPQQRFKRESHLCCFASYKTSSCQIYFTMCINIYTP